MILFNSVWELATLAIVRLSMCKPKEKDVKNESHEEEMAMIHKLQKWNEGEGDIFTSIVQLQ
ncbi:Uncharacterized protein BM_BM584 [Brugia malayi]|uniref:Bm584 n=1 Tax=Brugia malayi TaxID=6279 RepID=A0A0K0JKL0_BRUMA|nr:Uncharacterized protein BM_BM584 [Brugia malayi]CDP98567.1 Bm584 [Brugia malayi]VIO98868.1 Uncharacterized protein BM_BM584 [Brugia malayi]